MIVRVTCPNPECSAVSKVEEQSLGRRGRCKQCGHVFALTRLGEESASAMSAAPSAAVPSGANSSPQAPHGPLNLPEQFGRYRIMRLLGQGGMGAVYLGHDTRLDRQVAIKVPFFSPSDGPEAVLRFEREAKAAATLDHPNLCPVHDVGEVDGIHYFTMPYIEGKTLAAVIAKDRVRAEQGAAAVVRKLALAVQVAHERGIIHRDLKPGNVLVSKHRELVIMDFGLARRGASDDSPLTRTGMALGTALYMAPEQALGDQALIGPRCDVYSLGVILHEMLTGVRPFEGPWSVVIGLKSVMDPDPPSRHRPDLSPSLNALVLKAIAKKPEDRFASMAEFADALGSFLAGRSESPSTPSAQSEGERPPKPSPETLASEFLAKLATGGDSSSRGDRLSGGSKVVQPEAQSTPPRPRKRKLLIAAAGVAALILGLIAAWKGGMLRTQTPEGTWAGHFSDLFNHKDFSGWRRQLGEWKIRDDGCLTATSATDGSNLAAILATERDDFRNFRLRVTTMDTDDIRKAIVARHSADTKVNGYTISFGGTKSPHDQGFEPIGSIRAVRDEPARGHVTRTWDVKAGPIPADGEKWQTLEIEIIKNRVMTRVGGRVLARYEDDQPGRERGAIVIVCSVGGVKLIIKEISIQELDESGEPLVTSGAGEDEG